MTTAEAQKFYEQDLKKYDISKNKELLTWLKELCENGYHSFINIEQLQELIDNIVYWYEIKYPECEMEYYEKRKYYNIENMDKLSKVMDIKQLIHRLPFKQLCLMKCHYRSNGGGIRDIYNDNGEIVESNPVLFMNIDRKDVEYNSLVMCSKAPYFTICAANDSGKVYVDYNLKEYINTENIILDYLLVLFKEKYADELNLTQLEQCIYQHNCDIELRRKILQLAALKLLYSHNTIPERGYERAQRFINEFNESMNLNLSTEEIDKAINRDYSKDEKIKRVLKIYVDKENNSYRVVEDFVREEKKSLDKTKK